MSESKIVYVARRCPHATSLSRPWLNTTVTLRACRVEPPNVADEDADDEDADEEDEDEDRDSVASG
jgi:hypothetical protein